MSQCSRIYPPLRRGVKRGRSVKVIYNANRIASPSGLRHDRDDRSCVVDLILHSSLTFMNPWSLAHTDREGGIAVCFLTLDQVGLSVLLLRPGLYQKRSYGYAEGVVDEGCSCCYVEWCDYCR